MRNTRTAFTLIELLVVVTIIVVLLALLVPAMDKAIYAAEMAVCAARQKVIATAVQTYAVENKRTFPRRDGVEASNTDAVVTDSWEPYKIAANGHDDRPKLRPYMSINATLQDPLAGEVDLDNAHADSWVYSNYNLWFGFRYATETGSYAGMKKLGDKLGFEGQRFNWLASDYDVVLVPTPAVLGSHPDRNGLMQLGQWQDAGVGVPLNPAGTKVTLTRWHSDANKDRGLIDIHAVAGDGAVSRYNDVKLNEIDKSEDARMARVPAFDNGTNFVGGTAVYGNLPLR